MEKSKAEQQVEIARVSMERAIEYIDQSQNVTSIALNVKAILRRALEQMEECDGEG